MDNLKPIKVSDSPNHFDETLQNWIEDIQGGHRIHRRWPAASGTKRESN